MEKGIRNRHVEAAIRYAFVLGPLSYSKFDHVPLNNRNAALTCRQL